MRVPTSRCAQRRQDGGVAGASADLVGSAGWVGGRRRTGRPGHGEQHEGQQDGGRLDLVLAAGLLRARGGGLEQLQLLLRLLEGRLQLLEQSLVRLVSVAKRLL